MKSKILKKLSTVGVAFTAIVLWLAIINVVIPQLIVDVDPFSGGFIYSPIGLFFFGCIFAPLWEELAFRHGPLQLVKSLKEKLKLDVTIPVVIISSAIFGWGHGMGALSIMIQGIGGLLLSYVYIKNKYSYWSSVLLHFLWNFSLMYLFPIFAAQYGIEIW